MPRSLFPNPCGERDCPANIYDYTPETCPGSVARGRRLGRSGPSCGLYDQPRESAAGQRRGLDSWLTASRVDAWDAADRSLKAAREDDAARLALVRKILATSETQYHAHGAPIDLRHELHSIGEVKLQIPAGTANVLRGMGLL